MILLSFDIEEFDMPLEYGKAIPFEEQMSISVEGTTRILDLLAKYHLKATFYTTATFAIHAPQIMERIVNEKHEIASHSYYHSDFKVGHLRQSREKLEELTKTKVIGYRMPRMQPVDEIEIFNAGYVYNSSLNPTFLPGRYNNFDKPRTYFMKDGVWQLPASVTPWLRFPLFWLSFHNLPIWLYKILCRLTIRKDGYLNLYFHPWEFTDLTHKTRFGFPNYVSKNSGHAMVERLDNLILWMKKNKYVFHCTRDLIHKIQSEQ
jgi:peptidoglycan/xylan/chitin deacetylase (PgdA/CDA1 family)